MRATAIAHPNIALVKYWGKRDGGVNLPAVGSLSITLDGMRTRTTVSFDRALRSDEVLLNGREDPATRARVAACLDLLRQRAGVAHCAHVTSDNDFPTGAGLASSAAGFAALAVAAAAALDFAAPPGLLNAMARIGSGSAPRSLFGGFALLENADDDITCRQLRPAEEWPLAVIVAVTNAGPKAVSSRAGMAQSRTTSPYYAEWVRSHPVDLVDGIACVARRDFDGLAAVAERSCLKMHAVMQTTAPPLLYWEPATLACMQTIGVLRREGTPVFFTIDAGPQVKAVCLPAAADAVRSALASTPGVTQLIQCRLGAGAHRVDG